MTDRPAQNDVVPVASQTLVAKLHNFPYVARVHTNLYTGGGPPSPSAVYVIGSNRPNSSKQLPLPSQDRTTWWHKIRILHARKLDVGKKSEAS